MSLTKNSFYSKGLLYTVSFLLFSCYQKEAPPFPYAKKYTVSPTTKSLKTPVEDTLKWQKAKTRAYANLPTKKFSWDKLESQRLELGFPYKANLPLPEVELNFDSLPYVDFRIGDFDRKNQFHQE